MPNVDIVRNSKEGYDILLLDIKRYMHTSELNYILSYLHTHLSNPIISLWDWSLQEHNVTILQYSGFAIKLQGLLRDRNQSKLEILETLKEALFTLDTL